MARVLVACEFSGIVREEFRKLGHDAWSCDLLPTEIPGQHYQGDIRNVLVDGNWDLVIAHPPCFPAGTLIVTKRGLIPIEDIVIGDQVVTHKNRWKKVSDAGSRQYPVLTTLKGKGCCGLTCTPEHPLWTMKRMKDHKKVDGNYKWTGPEWVEAGSAVHRYWATPLSIPQQEIPFPFEFQPNNDFWYMIGRWVGDGWCRQDKGKECTIICCGNHEVNKLDSELKKSSALFNNDFVKSKERTTYRFTLHNIELVQWMTCNFGSGAHNKTIPTWLLSAPEEWRRSFLRGYQDADGDSVRHINLYGATTVSKYLAIGIRLLVEGLGFRTALYREKKRKKKHYLEGRLIEYKSPPYVLRWRLGADPQRIQAYRFGEHAWSLIKSLKVECGDFTVYNITVEDDQSYVADGFVVHNCTYLANSGVRHLYKEGRLVNGRNEQRWKDMRDGAEFFKLMLECSAPRVCVENPIQHRYAREIIGEGPTQIIQPFMFGHGETKATCLWLKGLPKLVPTDVVDGREPRVHHESPGPDRWKNRSRTLVGIARGMAEQWSRVMGD